MGETGLPFTGPDRWSFFPLHMSHLHVTVSSLVKLCASAAVHHDTAGGLLLTYKLSQSHLA